MSLVYMINFKMDSLLLNLPMTDTLEPLLIYHFAKLRVESKEAISAIE